MSVNFSEKMHAIRGLAIQWIYVKDRKVWHSYGIPLWLLYFVLSGICASDNYLAFISQYSCYHKHIVPNHV